MPATARANVPCVCPVCGCDFLGHRSAINRAAKLGYEVRCSRKCSGLARRRTDWPSIAEQKRRKAEYDRKRRAEKRDEINAKKRASYYRNHKTHLARQRKRRQDPEVRTKHKAYIKEYQERPGWKEYKAAYDRVWRAKNRYGEEWAEAHLMLMALTDTLNESTTGHDRRRENDTYNKCQTRRREDGQERSQR